jgi:hypothetical protein
MTTSLTVSDPGLDDPGWTPAVRRLTGAAAVGFVLLNFLVVFALGPGVVDTLSPDATEQARTALADDGVVTTQLVAYAAEVLFVVLMVTTLVGVRSLVRTATSSSWLDGLVAAGTTIVLAASVIYGILAYGIPVTLRQVPDFEVADPGLVLLLAQLLLMDVVMLQIGLAIVIAVVSAVGLRTGVLPRWLAWWGFVGAAAAAVLTVTPFLDPEAAFAVFLASNLTRLLWLVSLGVLLLAGRAGRPALR